MTQRDDTALAASFITLGLVDAGKPDDIYECWARGGVGLHHLIVEYAALSERVFNVINNLDRDSCPGIWMHEVPEPFGKWLGKTLLAGGDYSAGQATLTMVKIACLFWTADNRDPAIDATALMLKVSKEMGIEPPIGPKNHTLEGRVTELEEALLTERAATNCDRAHFSARLDVIEGLLTKLNENIAGQIKGQLRFTFGQIHDAL